MTSGGARRLLVIHPGALGDLVQALPAFAALRAAFGPETALLVGASHAAFVADLGLFGRVLTFDDAVAYHGAAGGRLRVLARAARDARAFRPAACAVFKAAPVYAALARASGARVRVGLTHGRLAAPLLTTAVPLTAHSHWETRYAAVAAALGAAALPDAAAAWPATAAGAVRGAEDHAGVVIGIAPGGARNVKADLPQKRWPAARFAEVAARLAGRRPVARVVLFGGPGDRAEADAVRAALPAGLPVEDRVGRTTVAGARDDVARLSLFLTNDSALLHVAASTATPTIAVFGPTDPRAICPRAPSVTAVWDRARAEPCYDDLTGRVRRCTSPCCMDRVSPEAVAAAAAAALDARRP